jgi:hypothetical protein
MSPTVQSRDLTAHMFTELQRPKQKLTPWELDFIASVLDQFNHKGSLSPKQFAVLERIYAEKTA